jgi:8-oxo-dGTP diphosphatase
MIRVTCAVIRNEDNEVLIVQRGEYTDHPFKWEFPGGKLNLGETEEDCILREVREELSLDIVICGRLPEVEYNYGHKQIVLIPFICDTLDELPFLSEHVDFRWLHASALKTVDFSEADIFVADYYIERQKPEDVLPAEKIVSDSSFEAIIDQDLQNMVNNMMSMKEAEWIATSAVENPAIFMKLFEYSKSTDKKLAFRASWTLTKVCDKYPEMIYPYLSEIVEVLNKIDNESALRSFLRIISLTDPEKINSGSHGILVDFCFDVLKSGYTAIAVKAYSMEILYRQAVIYPELVNELAATLRILMEDASAGISARGSMIIKKLGEIPIAPGSSRK